MSSLHHMLGRARRRMLIDNGLRRLGWGVAIAAVIAIVLLVLDRLTSVAVPESAYWIVLGVSAIAGVIHAFITQPSRLELAVRLDRQLRLKDRIGTAAGLNTAFHVDPEFAELVQHEAQHLAGRLDIRSATPIQLTPIWAASVSLIGLLAAGILFMPAIEWNTSSDIASTITQEQQQITEQARTAAESIRQAVAELPRDEADESLDDRTQADLEALDRLAEQLAQKPASPEELATARDESAARMTELAEQFAARSQRDLAAADEVARRFAGMDKIGAPAPPMSAQQFSEAIKRGDFGDAAKQLDDLIARDDLTPADRREAADHLRELADHMEKAEDSNPKPAEPADNRESLFQALQEQGVDEQAAKELLKNPPDADELEQALRDRGVDEDIARQLARDIDQHQEERETNERADEAERGIKDALDQAADELEHPSPPQPPAQSPPSSQSPPSPQPNDSEPQRQPGDSSESSPQDSQKPPDAKPTSDDRPATSSADKPQPQQPSPSSAPKPDATAPSSPNQSKPQQQPQSQPQSSQQTQQKPGEQPAAQPSSPPPDSQSPDASKQQQQQEQGSDPAAAREVPKPGESPNEPAQSQQSPDQPQPDRTSTPDQKQQEQGEQSQNGSAPKPTSPSDALRKLAERMASAKDRQQLSERMRQAARDMAERMTPEEREQWARQWQRERGASPDQNSDPIARGLGNRTDGPFAPPEVSTADSLDSYEKEPIEIGGNDPADRTIAQWLSDTPPESAAIPNDRASSPQHIRQAQQVAERAVNESAVQKRYHRMIQKYFGRLTETTQRATGDAGSVPASGGDRAKP